MNGVYISVVTPVFNEWESLKEFYSELNAVLKNINKSYEVIFIDDGSRDNSPDILKELKARDHKVKVITFCRNFGQHAAVMAGFKAAEGEVVVTLDADLQNPPQEIPALLNKIQEGFDVVSGRRKNRKDSLIRKYCSFIMNIMISKLTGVKLSDYGCMLMAYKRNVINYLLKYGEKSVYIPALAIWLSLKSAEIPVAHHPRKHGRSKYSFLRFLRQSFDLITAYTLVPIQLISITGVVFAILGIFLAGYLISYRIFWGTTSTLTTFISALLFFSGIILFSMGVISEYIVRIYNETRRLPLYIIKEGPDDK